MNAPVAIADIQANYARIRRQHYAPRPAIVALPKTRPFAPRWEPEPAIPVDLKIDHDAHVIAFRIATAPVTRHSLARAIQREVCETYGLTLAQVIGPDRRAQYQPARREMAYRLKHEAGLSLTETGRRMGGRDHTTILASIRRHIERLDSEAAK